MAVKNIYSHQALAQRSSQWQACAMDRMREIREARSLTQADLSAMTGINQGFLSKVEKGQANPSLDKIKAIAEALRVQPYELFMPADLKARAMLAIGAMEEDQAAAAVVVLEAMAAGGKPQP